ncbi:MAG: YHS domain-containing protein, partial [Bdellovibrionales bacterium]|nr:YHS domain-containing protein [Bdellovibrionales bacterium]
MENQNHDHHDPQHKKMNDAVFTKDPVCGMNVAPDSAKGKSDFEGHTYLFCSLKCKSKFDQNPKQYLTPVKPAPQADIGVEYTCAMHPEVRQIGPGSCPICGMALEPVTATDQAEDNSEYKTMLKRFWVSAALSIPLLFVTMGGRHL